MAKYAISYIGMFDRQGRELPNADGYHADEFLPGYDEQTFDNENLGQRWIESNHKGPDVDGVEARFLVRLAEASDFFVVGQRIDCPTTDLDDQPAAQAGRVVDLAGEYVTVAWDDGQRTTQHFSVLI